MNANFSSWQFEHFAEDQLLDISISGSEADPDKDSINNLLEYAYGTNPWAPESGVLPVIAEDSDHLSITFRKAHIAWDLLLNLQTSNDLVSWTIPNGVTTAIDYSLDDVYLVRLTDSADTSHAKQRFLRLKAALDADQDGLPDDWEVRYFKNFSHFPDWDDDGDGLSNIAEYRQNTDPADYYNSVAPQLVLISGNNQTPEGIDLPLPQDLVVRVQTPTGSPLKNAPLQYLLISGEGDLSPNNYGTLSDGTNSATFIPYDIYTTSTIQVKAVGYDSAVTFTVLPKVDAPVAKLADRRNDGVVDISWTHARPSHATFTVERAADGLDWQEVGTSPAGSTNFTDATALSGVVYVYRVRAQGATASAPSQPTATEPDEDADGDGLTNQEEAVIGSLRQNAHSDSDLLPDGEDAIPTDGDLTFARVRVPHFALVKLPEDFEVTGINSQGVAVGSSAQGMQVWAGGQCFPIPVYTEGEMGLFNLSNYGNASIDDQGKIAYSQSCYGTGVDLIPNLYLNGNITGIYQFNGAVVTRVDLLSSIAPSPSGLQIDTSFGNISPSGQIFGSSLNIVSPFVKFPPTDDSPAIYIDQYYRPSTIWATSDHPTELNGLTYKNDRVLTQIPTMFFNLTQAIVYNQKGIEDGCAVWGVNSLGHYFGNTTEYYDTTIDFLLKTPGYNAIASYLYNGYTTENFGLIWLESTAEPVSLSSGSAAYGLNDMDIAVGLRGITEQNPTLWLGEKNWMAKDLPIYGEKKKYIFPSGIDNRCIMLMSNYTDLWVNGLNYDLGELSGQPNGTVYSGQLTESGILSAKLYDPVTSNSTSALLLPVEVVPDFNRDGIIDDKDRSKVNKDNPFRFWINDDDDLGETEGDDIPDDGTRNWNDNAVNGVRDLVDFFPLWLDINQLLETLPPDQYTYYLKQADNALSFAYTDLKPAGGEDEKTAGAFLNDPATAQQLKAAQTYQITNAGVQLTTAFLNTIKNDKKGVLLVEGRLQTTKPLVLEVRKNTGGVITTAAFEISIDSVEKMYRKWDLYNLGTPAVDNGKSDGSGPQNYPDKYCSNKAFVMVHGYNVNPEAARGWGAEMFKRFFQTGSKAKFYNVRWYGYETQVGPVTTNYQTNVNNAFAAAQDLAGLLSGVNNVTIAGHSLGNMLVSSAIQDWGASPQTYFMIDAAVAKQAYNGSEEDLSGGGQIGMEHPEWVPYAHRLWSAKWHVLFDASDNRSKLDWDDRLANVANINTYNFYSTGEEVLHNPTSAPHLPLSANEVWNNQERMKGRFVTGQILSSNYGGWEFNPYYDLNSFYHMDPALANGISNINLKVRPFFNPGPAELYGQNGSAYASPGQHRNTLLAEMVPALSFAAGSNNLESFGDGGNFDMMKMKNGWPRSNPDWQHSDVKIVAYIYLHKLYETFAELGELKQ